MNIKYLSEQSSNFDVRKIDIKNFNRLSRIYSFTTENIAGYFRFLDFTNKNVLTVAGSGDHVINAFYGGAKSVLGFDINYLALIFTELKLIALQELKYEEFLEFFLINNKDDIEKNINALDYLTYKNRLKKHLSQNAAKILDRLYQSFNNNGYDLRNSYIFNNKYDNNNIKIKSNLYLRSKGDYNKAKDAIKGKEIILLNSNYGDINLQHFTKYDIMLMSNISDYIKDIYGSEVDYVEEYIKEIIQKFKSPTNKIVCVYLYDIENETYRTNIDNPILRNNVFSKLNITYEEKRFESVMNNCMDSVIII